MEWNHFVSCGRNVFEHVCHMYMIVQLVISQQLLLLGKVRLVISYGCSQESSADSCCAEVEA